MILLVTKDILLAPVRNFNAAIRRVAEWTHHLEVFLRWRLPPQPEWQDHFADQYWCMDAKRTTHWLERGVFSRMLLRPGGSLLELCCGDGYYTKHFFSTKAAKVLAIDFDLRALKHARRFNAVPGVEYRFHDLRNGLPDGEFDNIIWDAAVAYFTEAEIAFILRAISYRLGTDGIFCGFTLVSNLAAGEKYVEAHEREFRSADDI